MILDYNCPCKKKKCERHGDCDACREHHAGSKRPPYCERLKSRKKRFSSLEPVPSGDEGQPM